MQSARPLHPPRHLPALFLGMALLLSTGACSPVSTPYLYEPYALQPLENFAPLKVHLHSGELVVLETWREEIETRQLVGHGWRYDPDRQSEPAAGEIQLSVDSIALLEISRSSPDMRHTLGVTLLAGYTALTATVAAICVSDPKSCFGSCPTFYLDDDAGQERLAAEGFSSSVARVFEATDLDDLRAKRGSGAFSVRMRNEALETHAIRQLRVHAVAEGDGERILQTSEGAFEVAERLVEPTRCSAPEGDCLEQVRGLDGLERWTPSDPADLAIRETLELEFPATEDAARLGIAVAARHSFVSTFLFYQMLAYLGRDAGSFLASLERGDGELAERVREVMALPERLEVEVQGSEGQWHSAGAVVEAGPLAADVQLLKLPERTGAGASGPIRVRLNLTRGFWRLEHVALVEIGESAESQVLTPVAIERLESGTHTSADNVTTVAMVTSPAPAALEALLDPDRYLVTEPGDHYRIEFELPPDAGGEGRDDEQEGVGYRLFLESTGHYYEWMRSEWLEEESPQRAAMMLLRPEVAFRELAPVFKEIEPEMEEAFWNSRFRR